MPPTIHYTIEMLRPETHRFGVTVEVRGWQADEATLVLPAWAPGSYLIREFARHVESFRAAQDGGAALGWQRVGKATWRVATAGVEAFHVQYEVYANDLTVRTSHLDTTHGYFNGSNVFMALDGWLAEPATLQIVAPPGWHASIALPQDDAGRYCAASYDALVDSPAEVGTHRVLRFEALGKPHEVALWGRGNEDEAALTHDLSHIVERVAAMFGNELPYERYLFIVHLGDGLGGGLEHRDATTLAVDRWTFHPASEYEKFLRLALHEFFHVWFVKRIRPHNLGPFDYTQEAYTPLLWVMEGFTTYYDLLLMRRAGLISPRRFLEALGDRISALRQQPGRLKQSLEESSLTAWVKFYRQDENYVNSGISYYLKGGLVALALDLAARARSGNARSLDDAVRLLWERYGRADVGFSPAQFEAALAEATGLDVGPLLDRWARGVDELPLGELLAAAGVRLTEAARPDSAPWTGLALRGGAGGLVVKHVLRDSPAEAAGLMAQDRLVALDGFELRDEAFLKARLGEKAAGDPVTFHLFRHGQLLDRRVTLGEPPADHVTLRAIESPTPAQRRLFTSWLAL